MTLEILRLVLHVFMTFCFFECPSHAQTIRSYPVGAIFDSKSADSTDAAFRHAVDEHNDRVRFAAKRFHESGGPTIEYNFELNYADRIYHIDVSDPYSLATTICQLAAQNVIAIYGVRDLKVENVLKDFIKVLRIPFITSGAISPNITKLMRDMQAANAGHQQDQAKLQRPVDYQVQIRPSFSLALIEVVNHLHWRHVTYMYDSNEGLMRFQYIYQYFSQRDVFLETYIRRVHSEAECIAVLESLNTSVAAHLKNKHVHVILDMSTEKTQRQILSQILKRRVLRFNFHYLTAAVGVKDLNLSNFADGGMNITVLRLWNSDTPAAVQFRESMKNLSSIYKTNRDILPYSYEAAFAYDSVKVLIESIKYLHDQTRDRDPFVDLFDRGELETGASCRQQQHFKYGETLLNSILNMPVKEGATGPLNFDRNGQRKNYSFEVWDVTVKRQVLQTGTWYSSSNRRLQPNYNHTERPIAEKGIIPFKQRIRIVTSVISPPFLMAITAPPNGRPLLGNERFEGFCSDFMQHISDDVKLDYIFKTVGDGNYGTNESGVWNGMIGELVRWEADMAVAPLTISVQREDVIDFSQPFLLLGLSVMVWNDPNQGKLSYLAFLTPLSYEIWMCIIFAYVAVSVVLFLVSRFSPTEWHLVATYVSASHNEVSNDGRSSGDGVEQHKVSVLRNDFTIGNSLWFVISAFMHQGTPVAPRSIPGRIVGAVWWFFTLIVISSYTANLAAFLTVERMNSPIKSAEDLSKQKQVKYGILNSGSSKDFFRNSKVPTYERMWTFMESNPDVFMSTTQSGVERVKNSRGQYAFLLESIMNEYWNERAPCTSKLVGDWLDSKGYGIGHSRPSDIRDRVNLAVLNLKELRVLTNLQTKWWQGKSECKMNERKEKDESQDDNSLQVDNILGLLLILMCGLVIGLLLAVCELLYKVQMESIKRKKPFFETMRKLGEPVWKLRRSSKSDKKKEKKLRRASRNSTTEQAHGFAENQENQPADPIPGMYTTFTAV